MGQSFTLWNGACPVKVKQKEWKWETVLRGTERENIWPADETKGKRSRGEDQSLRDALLLRTRFWPSSVFSFLFFKPGNSQRINFFWVVRLFHYCEHDISGMHWRSLSFKRWVELKDELSRPEMRTMEVAAPAALFLLWKHQRNPRHHVWVMHSIWITFLIICRQQSFAQSTPAPSSAANHAK